MKCSKGWKKFSLRAERTGLNLDDDWTSGQGDPPAHSIVREFPSLAKVLILINKDERFSLRERWFMGHTVTIVQSTNLGQRQVRVVCLSTPFKHQVEMVDESDGVKILLR